MPFFKKKPVTIEAKQFTGGVANAAHLAYWSGGRYLTEEKASDPTDVAEWLEIPTLEGVMRANKGDWIIKGVSGEFYPCKPDIFGATYEEVDPT